MAIRISLELFALYAVGVVWLLYLTVRAYFAGPKDARIAWRAALSLVWPLALLTADGRQLLLRRGPQP